MTEPSAETLRSVADALEKYIGRGLTIVSDDELESAMRPLIGHILLTSLIYAPDWDEGMWQWWLSAAALKLRQEADQSESDVLITAYGVVGGSSDD